MINASRHVQKLLMKDARFVFIRSGAIGILTIYLPQLRADYKLVAKAYGRIGSAYTKKDDLASAIKFFQKSLTEHRTPDILAKLRDTERLKTETERLAYIDPQKSAEAREEGNAFFKKGDFAGAVKAYTESIKRNPDDARGYNNRANAYTKLVALPEALKDADQAIKVDPKFSAYFVFVLTSAISNSQYNSQGIHP